MNKKVDTHDTTIYETDTCEIGLKREIKCEYIVKGMSCNGISLSKQEYSKLYYTIQLSYG